MAMLPSAAMAQSVWGGAGSTTTTTDYNLGTNWSTTPTPPTQPGESAHFDATGSATIVVTAGPITPDSWTFNATSQSYTLSGQAVNFGNAATLTNNASFGQAISISNNMTGATLSQAAASTLTISGTNTFTTTSVSAGTLVNGGSLTSTVGITAGTFTNNLTVTGAVNNAGTFNNNANGTVSGLLTNTAGTTTNAGQLNGGVRISGGTVALTSSGSITGSVTVGTAVATATFDISGTNAGASIVSLFGASDGIVTLGSKTLTLTAANSTFDGVINGTGGLALTGFETLIGANTYSGTTTVSTGTLSLAGSGSIALSSLVTVGTGVASATFDISNTTAGASIKSLSGASDGIVTLGTKTLALTAASDTFGGVIGGNGGLALTSGTETLTGVNTYSGTTTVNAGTLALTGAGSIAQSSLVTVGAGAASTFDISGTTSGTSIIGLAGDSNGIVALGSKTLTITNASSGNQFFGAINGTGGLTVTGGAQILGGNNGYTGVTTINTGAILGILGTGSIASSSKVIDNGALDLSVMSVDSSIKSLAGTNAGSNLFLGSHTLTLTAANDTYAGMISGSGGLTLAGGTETLTGSIGYSGATTINGGTLIVNSSLASSSGVTVNTGGTLMGTGAVGGTSIAGGTLAPGSGTPGSSLTVDGVLGFTAASTYAVNINPTTSSFANVTGTATLGGATVNATYANGSYVAKQYTILTAGVVNGHFGSLVNTNLPANFRTSLSYDAKDAFLNLALNFTPPPSGGAAPGFGSGLNVNQQNVGNALTNFFNATGGIPLVFGALTPTGLSQVSGETATGSQQTTFNAMTQFMNVMTDPFMAGRGDSAGTSGGASGYASEDAQAYAAKRSPSDALAAIYTKAAPSAPFEARWSTWVAGFGGSQTTNGNAAAGSNNTTSSIAGTAVGADYRFSPFTIAGFSLAGGGTSFSVAGGGSGHSDLFQAGVFVRHTVGAAYITGALAYGWQDITTNRTVSVAGIDQLRAEFNANTFSGRVEGGYRFISPFAGGIGITPYAAAQFTTFDLPAYAESVVSGAANFALAYGAKNVTDSRSELGLRTDKSFAMQDAILTLRGRFAWAHDYNPDRAVGATFQALPGASFVVNGAAQASESALTTASAELKWTNNWSVAATFEGEFSSVTSSYAGKGVVRYAW
jgi:autotransporter-associated beta strand protein